MKRKSASNITFHNIASNHCKNIEDFKKMSETKRKRPGNFKFEMPITEGKKQEIMQNLQNVREVLVSKLGRPVNNTDIMESLLDTWRQSLKTNDDDFKSPATYTKVNKSQVKQDFFVTSLQAVRKLIDVSASHGKYCKGTLEVK